MMIETPKHKYKHIVFEKVSESPSGKTAVFSCDNHSGESLGYIEWNNRWRQYTFTPLACTIYSRSCLLDIADFIHKLMEARKK